MTRRDTPTKPSLSVSAEFDTDLNVVEQILEKSQTVIGETLAGKYLLLDVRGEGGMAIVYRGKELGTNRIVAIKTLRFADPELTGRFAREVKIHENLRHPNIVEPIDCIELPDHRSFFVMELLDGIDLERLLENQGRLKTIAEIASVLSQIADALEYAHDQGVIHRDVKPENIILVEHAGKRTVKVLDFGVARIQDDLQRLTKTGVVLGSPAYMSPEQCMGMKLDNRSDIYSLGVVAYELITGSLPFDADSAVSMMEAHCDPNVHPHPIKSFRDDIAGCAELQQALDKALRAEVHERYQSIGEFKKDLDKWWRAAKAEQAKTEDSPFNISQSPETKPQPRAKEKVVSTMQVQSLQHLVHQRINYAEERAVPKAGAFSRLSGFRMPGFFSTRLGNLAGWVGLIGLIFGLSALMAYFMISMLNRPETAAAPSQFPAPTSSNSQEKSAPTSTPPQVEAPGSRSGITNSESTGVSSSSEINDATKTSPSETGNTASDGSSSSSSSSSGSSSGNRRRITSPAGNFRRMR